LKNQKALFNYPPESLFRKLGILISKTKKPVITTTPGKYNGLFIDYNSAEFIWSKAIY